MVCIKFPSLRRYSNTSLPSRLAQKIKSVYYQVQGTDFVGKSVVMGALTLYLDFVNMFTFLLSFMGDRR